MKPESYAVVALLLIFVGVCGFAFWVGYNDGVANYNAPTENITIAQTYPRVDAYMNHAPPFVITSDRKIYDVASDRVWAGLEIGKTYTVKLGKSSLTERQKINDGTNRIHDGMIYGVV